MEKRFYSAVLKIHKLNTEKLCLDLDCFEKCDMCLVLFNLSSEQLEERAAGCSQSSQRHSSSS